MDGQFSRVCVRTLIVLCGFVTILQAGPQRPLDEAAFRRLTRTGPFSIDVGTKGTFRVPTGYRMVTEEKMEEFGELASLPILGDETGLISMADRPTWFSFLIVLNEDPMKGLDPKQLNDPATRMRLLDWQRQFHESRRSRKGSTIVPTKVAAWTHTPRYDEKTKTLTMGVRLEAENEVQKDKVNYQSIVYGPGNTIVILSTIVDAENYDKAEKEAGKLAGEFSFNAQPVDAAAGQEQGEDTMFLPKVIGGGLFGAVGVLILFRLLAGGGGKKPVVQKRRPVAR